MNGDISRSTFDPKRAYTSVRRQQGRVELDADQNELVDILLHDTRGGRADTIGASGAPKDEPGFEVDVSGGDITISPGRFYVDGIRVVFEGAAPILYTAQPWLPGANLPAVDGLYVAYLEVWERPITALEDPHIREGALGGPDTSTRTQLVWQVKLLPITTTDAEPSCASTFAEWDRLIQGPTGTLEVRLDPGAPSSDPCQIPESSAYRGLENQLYRFQVHAGSFDPASGSGSGDPTFTWSRENASVIAACTAVDGFDVDMDRLGPGGSAGFASGDSVELTDERSALIGAPGLMAEVSLPSGGTLTLDVDTTSFFATALRPILRRWERAPRPISVAPDELGTAEVTADGWIRIENGIQIRFSGGTFRSGDFWLLPARVGLVPGLEGSQLDWPMSGGSYLGRRADGVARHYARLALLQRTGGAWFRLDDCRMQFPPLTDITAEDVKYDNSVCFLNGASTVQEAIEALCNTQHGLCTFTAMPGPGWEQIFTQVAEGQDAQICFPVGDYPAQAPVLVENKGHLRLVGAGRGARLLGTGAEAVLHFRGCSSVQVLDLYAEATAAPAHVRHQSGVLTFEDVPQVLVERVQIKADAGARKERTCMTIRNATERSANSTATVSRCELSIGAFQVGLLMVNVDRIRIEDNQIRGPQGVSSTALTSLLANNHYMSAVAREFGIPQPDGHPMREARVALPGNLLDLARRRAGSSSASPAALRSNMARILRDPDARRIDREVARWVRIFSSEYSPTAAQAVVVGGTRATDVFVTGNSISGVSEGIHVGLSQGGDRSVIFRAGRIRISDNVINTRYSLGIGVFRRAIFVGNVNSLSIESNQSEIARGTLTRESPADGITLFGNMGRMIVVRANHLIRYTTGVRFHPLSSPTGSRQWYFADNCAEDAEKAVVLESPPGYARTSGNSPP